MNAHHVSLANRRLILLAVLSLVASLLTVGFNAPGAGAATEEVSFDSAGPSNVEETVGSVALGITVTSDPPSFLGPVEFDISTVGSSATAGALEDYTLSQSSFSFAAAGTQTLTVTINDNSTYEGAESIVLTISNVTPGTATAVTPATHTINIADTADLPTLGINTPAAVDEGSAVGFTVTRSGASDVPITFNVTTSDGTAGSGDYSDDFTNPITIAAGAPGTASFNVDAETDSVYEGGGTEDFNVLVDNIVGADATPLNSSGTITDTTALPTISVNSPAAVDEGDPVVFTVTRSIDSTVPITFNATTADDTADSGDYSDDFTNPITITAGAPGTASFNVNTTADGLYEGGQESFNVLIDNISGATAGTAGGTGTINDLDSEPTITLSSPSANEEAGTLTFVATLSEAIGVDVTALANSAGISTEGSDFAPLVNQPVTIDAGETSVDIPVAVLDDAFYETDETFTVALSSVVNATGAPSGTGTIQNDADLAPVISIDSPSNPETPGPTTFTITRTGFTEVAVTGSASTIDGTATAADDFDAVTAQLITIPADTLETATTTVVVAHKTDLIDETLNETFSLTVSGITGATPASVSGIGTIVDDDGEPALSISDATITEGGTAIFTISRVGDTALPITVTATTGDPGDSALAPGDYDATALLRTITVGSASTTFSVPTNEDLIDEADEEFTVTLSGATNAVIADGIGIGTIEDDDAPPTLAISNETATEAGGPLVFTITRTGLTERVVSVNATTVDVTATAGSDYTANTDSVTIPSSGPTNSATFSVAVTDDPLVEVSETLEVDLSAASNATISDPTGVGTITDNDTAGLTITETDDNTSVLEGGTTDTYDVVLSSQPSSDVTVYITPDAQITTNPTELTFTNGNWDTPQTVTVTAEEDGTDEPDPHEGIIQHSTVSAHTPFNGLAIPNLTVNVGDADALLATLVGPTKGVPGTAATFTAMVNAGGTGKINYEWVVYFNGNLTTITGPNDDMFAFTPDRAGVYFVEAIVSDDKAETTTDFITFTALGDVAGHTFESDIIWLAEEGITKGCNPAEGNTKFCPDDIVTRGQMAAFLVRFLGLTDNGGGDLFTDDDTSIFEENIDRLATAGITKGCNPAQGNTHFCPESYVTRGQMAAFLHRADALK